MDSVDREILSLFLPDVMIENPALGGTLRAGEAVTLVTRWGRRHPHPHRVRRRVAVECSGHAGRTGLPASRGRGEPGRSRRLGHPAGGGQRGRRRRPGHERDPGLAGAGTAGRGHHHHPRGSGRRRSHRGRLLPRRRHRRRGARGPRPQRAERPPPARPRAAHRGTAPLRARGLGCGSTRRAGGRCRGPADHRDPRGDRSALLRPGRRHRHRGPLRRVPLRRPGDVERPLRPTRLHPDSPGGGGERPGPGGGQPGFSPRRRAGASHLAGRRRPRAPGGHRLPAAGRDPAPAGHHRRRRLRPPHPHPDRRRRHRPMERHRRRAAPTAARPPRSPPTWWTTGAGSPCRPPASEGGAAGAAFEMPIWLEPDVPFTDEPDIPEATTTTFGLGDLQPLPRTTCSTGCAAETVRDLAAFEAALADGTPRPGGPLRRARGARLADGQRPVHPGVRPGRRQPALPGLRRPAPTASSTPRW